MKPLRDGLVIFGLGILGAGAWLAVRSTPTIVPLPGGQTMRIMKVSLGTNHMLALEPIWKQALRRMLPEGLQKPLGPPQLESRHTRGEALVVWVDAGKKYKGVPFILQ